MSLAKVTFIERGILKESRYDFAEAGDVIPMHVHGESDKHITLVSRGSVKAAGPWGEITLKAGESCAWAAGQEHEITGLEPNSRVHNIVY